MFETALDHFAITKRVRVFAESNGFSVNFIDDGGHPSASSRGVINITKPNPKWTEEQLLEWEWTVYHEIGHMVPAMRDIFDTQHKHKINADVEDPELLPAMLNNLDDYRQEKYDYRKYAGRDLVLSKGRAQFMERHLVPAIEKHGVKKANDKGKRLIAFDAALTKMRTSWQRDIIGLDERYASALDDPQVREWYEKALEYQPEIDAIQTAEEEYELIMRMIEEVFQDDAKEEEKKAQEQAAQAGGDQEGEGGEGQGKRGQGKGKAKGQGSDSKDGKDFEKRLQDGTVRYDDIAMHHDNGKSPSYHSLTIDYTGHRDRDDYLPSDKNVIRDFTSNPGLLSSKGDNYANRINRLPLSSGLANKLRKLLQVKSQSINVYGKKSGKLANKNVHRVTMSGTGEYQRKVFKQRIENNILDTAVTVLCDFSGSMGGDKITHAIASALILNDALAKIGVPVEITGFTDNYHSSEFFVFKSHKKQIGRDQLLDFMDRACYNMSGNADGEAILWAYDRLRRQDNKRKLLIVLSDGQPAGGTGGDIYAFTKRVVKKIEERHDVEIYGIGIMSDAVNNIYKHRRTINSASELEPAILTVIKDYILN